MNDSIEQALQAWRPKPPSPGLRSRIFASSERAETTAVERAGFDMGALTRWLVPAMGCFVIATASLTGPPAHAPAGRGSASSLSEQQLAFSLAANHSEMNNLPATTVQRSFGQRPSYTGNAAPSVTNTLSK